MLRVSFTSSFRSAFDGADQLELEASSIRELFNTLLTRYPRLQNHIDEGVAVAIEGKIYRDDWGAAIPDNSEVFLMPRIQGG
jgi:molybdopterin synthase sulfur carrier subunit